ncbi:MAG TPA: GNAT family N-acetyltransferase [Kofleriaceae bacterium]|nr:GNAT family N-acetyltransferase [Kofleriaceae bacterium]
MGLTTELAVLATRGRVVDRGDYLVTATPDDPSYHHGHMLVLPAAPRPGELPALLERFAREVATDPAIRHVTLLWDGVTGDVPAAAELAAAGFVLEPMHVMTAARAVSPRPVADPAIELRPLAADELVRAAELAFAVNGEWLERYRRFYHRRAAWQRDLVARRLAEFWGAFDAQTLVASLGVVRLGRLGRYQDVQTAASHRGRGLASALLARAGDAARARGVEELVILTAPNTAAERVYARAGFRVIECSMSACREPTR